MNKSEIMIKVTARTLLDKGKWIKYCNKYDINEWAISEGLMSSSDEVDISLEDAEDWGLIEDKKNPENLKELEDMLTDEIESKYVDTYERQAQYMGNGIYSISGLYSTDTRELYLMFIGQQEFEMEFE